MDKKIKFAVVGFGHIGKRHAEMVRRNPHTQLVTEESWKPLGANLSPAFARNPFRFGRNWTKVSNPTLRYLASHARIAIHISEFSPQGG